MLATLVRQRPAPVWLVVAEEPRLAERLAEDVLFFHAAAAGAPALEARVFPESLADSRDMREAFLASSDRLAVLSRLRPLRQAAAFDPARAPALLVATTPAALLQPVPALAEFDGREIALARGQRQPFHGLLEQLRAFDYDSEAVCEAPGQYAVRGGIVDIYPVTALQPYRLDFFGDEIEDIRALDPVTQRSGEAVDRITLSASPRLPVTPSGTGLADYLGPLTHLVFIEPATLEERSTSRARRRPTRPRARRSAVAGPSCPLRRRVRPQRSRRGLGPLRRRRDRADLGHGEPGAPPALPHRRAGRPGAAAGRGAGARTISSPKWDAGGRTATRVVFTVAKDGEEAHMREILGDHPAFARHKPRFLRGTVNEGFRIKFRDGATCRSLLAGELSPKRARAPEPAGPGRSSPRRRSSAASGNAGPGPTPRAVATPSQIDQLLDFSELVEGDFVVHLQHGIALYRGLTKIDTAQGVREVISLEFDDQVTLHVPLQESHLITRYVGLGKTRPQLGRIGSGRWEKARAAAERATLDLAAELLQIQARREAQPGHAFGPDTAWQKRVRGVVSLHRDARPAPRDRRDQGRHGADPADGPAHLRRRRLRKDRGRDPGRLQGGAGRPPGGRARPDDRARPAAPQHLPRAHGRLPDRGRDAQPLPVAGRADADPRRRPPPARSTS